MHSLREIHCKYSSHSKLYDTASIRLRVSVELGTMETAFILNWTNRWQHFKGAHFCLYRWFSLNVVQCADNEPTDVMHHEGQLPRGDFK